MFKYSEQFVCIILLFSISISITQYYSSHQRVHVQNFYNIDALLENNTY